MDQGSTRKRSAVHNFAPTVTKFCVMWEGQALPHDTKFGNSRCEIVGRRVIFIWSLIHGSSWSGLIKVGPGHKSDMFFTYLHRLSITPSVSICHDVTSEYCSDVITSAMASQFTSLTAVYLTVYSGTDLRKTSKLRVTGLCAGNSPVTGTADYELRKSRHEIILLLLNGI